MKAKCNADEYYSVSHKVEISDRFKSHRLEFKVQNSIFKTLLERRSYINSNYLSYRFRFCIRCEIAMPKHKMFVSYLYAISRSEFAIKFAI